jgi:hypothetical protein
MIACPQTAAAEGLSFPYKMLIVTSCTKDKVVPSHLPSHALPSASELWDERDDDRLLRNYGELEQYRTPAVDLYRGLQHTELMHAVRLLRRTFGTTCVDVKIVSAGFGLVGEEQPLPPYNATFADQSSRKILTIAHRLGIPQAMNLLMQEPYNCAFFLLGETYLSSLDLPFYSDPSFPCFFLASHSNRLPMRHPYYHVPIGKEEGIAFHFNQIGLKGHLFRLFAEQMVVPERLESFLSTPTPQFFLSSIHPVPRRVMPKEQIVQQSLFPDVCIKALEGRAKNYGRPMRFFIPDWDDLVDPSYDFESDQGTPGKRRYDDEVYAHQLYERPNYDGLLFSKATIGDGAAKFARVKEMGIHRFAKWRGKPIFADCGAFSYIESEVPPYQTQEILDYYQNLGFDYGVSIDHLVIPAFYPVKEFRYALTRKNAREFLELHKSGGYTFTPVGVAQGWSPETYRDAVAELLELGYQYVALGGIARTPTRDIREIMRAVAPVLKEDTDLHLFGVARDRDGNEMQIFREMGVTSFDSATFLRRAWLGTTENYYTEDGTRYIALRISPVNEARGRVKKLLSQGVTTIERLKKLEQDALKAVREYDRGRLNLDTALDVLLEIDLLDREDLENYESHQVLYRRVLEVQPWKKCPCTICRELGIEVMIFRGNDRNRRRGFHNTFVFYQRFQKLMEQVSHSRKGALA